TRHAPEQALAPRLSFSKRYSVWPRLSTMIRPKALEPVATDATRADDPLEATAVPTPANARTARTVIPNTTVFSPFISGLLRCVITFLSTRGAPGSDQGAEGA